MIIKFQQGGIAPLVSYEPVTVTGGAAATTSGESSSGSDLTDKDLLELLKDLNGLPSDIASITNNLQNGEDISVLDENYDLINHIHISEPCLNIIKKIIQLTPVE